MDGLANIVYDVDALLCTPQGQRACFLPSLTGKQEAGNAGSARAPKPVLGKD